MAKPGSMKMARVLPIRDTPTEAMTLQLKWLRSRISLVARTMPSLSGGFKGAMPPPPQDARGDEAMILR